MNTHFENALPNSIDGHLLQLGEGHEAAIYTRDGVFWVAEFRNGSAELVDAATFFHFHVGALRYSHARRAAALESATSLTPEVLEKIARLHQSREAHTAEIGVAVATSIESFKHHIRVMMSRIRGQASKRMARIT